MWRAGVARVSGLVAKAEASGEEYGAFDGKQGAGDATFALHRLHLWEGEERFIVNKTKASIRSKSNITLVPPFQQTES